MALKSLEDCTNCEACKPVCPTQAISIGDPIYVIDALRCTECVGAEEETQCFLVCPAACIEPDREWPETPEELQAKYDMIHS